MNSIALQHEQRASAPLDKRRLRGMNGACDKLTFAARVSVAGDGL